MILQYLLHMPQFELALGTADPPPNAQSLSNSWGICSKHCSTWLIRNQKGGPQTKPQAMPCCLPDTHHRMLSRQAACQAWRRRRGRQDTGQLVQGVTCEDQKDNLKARSGQAKHVGDGCTEDSCKQEGLATHVEHHHMRTLCLAQDPQHHLHSCRKECLHVMSVLPLGPGHN